MLDFDAKSSEEREAIKYQLKSQIEEMGKLADDKNELFTILKDMSPVRA